MDAEAAFYPPPGDPTDTKVIVGNGDIVYNYALLKPSIDEDGEDQGHVNAAAGVGTADPIYDMAG